MNQPNPFTSQQSAQEQLNKSRARLRFAVFGALALCLLVLVPLLVQGCKREEIPVTPPVDTNAPVVMEDTNLPPVDLAHTNVVLPPIGVPSPTAAPTMPIAPVAAPVSGGSEHVVAKGDSFYTIGKKYGVSTKAISDANPGVDSRKLKIGQKLNIPAAAGAAATAAPAGAPIVEAAAGEKTYTVKSGDTLTRIAKSQGASVKVIKAANNLTTDKIKVGQKLKIPVKEAAPAPAPVVEAAPMVVPPSAAPTAAPSLPPMTSPK